MVYRHSRVILGLLLLLLFLAMPTVALAGNPQVHITVNSVVIGYPGNFTVTYVNDYQVDTSWTIPAGGNNTMVRGAVGRYPTSMTDGYLVYLGNGTFASDTGVSLDETAALVYYRAWTQNNAGIWSALYAEGNIGGTGMTALGNIILLGILMFASLTCTIAAYGFRKASIAYLGTGLWALLGFFAFTLSTSLSPIQITDIYMGLFWLTIAMVIVSIFEPMIMKAPSIDEVEPEAELSSADQMKAEYAAMQKEMGVGIFSPRHKKRRLPRL